MSASLCSTSFPFSESSFSSFPRLCSNASPITAASNHFHSVTGGGGGGRLVLNVRGSSLCRRFGGFKQWILDTLNFPPPKQPISRNRFKNNLESTGLSNEKGEKNEVKR
ncbi:hypothetical protein RJT34_19192 [Clitoria ternatea]|uniref:Uncharacterized protein n=1 Tax=Clitoria ternatea TaxID=43366 RepID=A0AAN9IQW0_CLITE